jgi:hypothetical protein
LIQVEARMRNIDSNTSRVDSIVADSYFTERLRRPLQQNRPIAVIRQRLFDHLGRVRGAKDAERLGGPAINDQLDFLVRGTARLAGDGQSYSQ